MTGIYYEDVDITRIDIVLRFGYSCYSIPSTEIRIEESCSGPKVGVVYNHCLWAAVIFGREFQLFLLGYIITQICEIFTVGGFPLDSKVVKVQCLLRIHIRNQLIRI